MRVIDAKFHVEGDQIIQTHLAKLCQRTSC